MASIDTSIITVTPDINVKEAQKVIQTDIAQTRQVQNDQVSAIILLFFIIGIILIWVITLIDILSKRWKSSMDKLIWILLVLFLPFLGTILYMIVGRKQK
ncbi:MAG: PLD nuclease N-terminal domain-containing protein [bacterium]|nr:PLD nuclease N-terminal domain-containing protein [bacterium]